MPAANKNNNSALPTVALVGRVNVGKSTLFNKLIEEQKAIVSDVPGTTRTANEGIVLWRGKEFRLIDTGGLTFEEDVPLEEDILVQSEKAMKKADLVVFVTDASTGVLPQERELAKRLRRIETKPVVLVANKADTKKIEKNLTEPEWYKLGLGEPFPISSASGRNVGDFLDLIYELLEKSDKKPAEPRAEETGVVTVSIIGKPNVGKSSLFNKLIGEDRVIVSDMPHTTREPHDTIVEYKYQENDEEKTQAINFVDTAGIRRKTKVSGRLEKIGIQKSIDMLERSDVILFVLDATEEISHQDLQLGDLMERKAKSVIILLNKWDLSESNDQAAQTKAREIIYSRIPHLKFAHIMLVSGKTGYGVHKIFPELLHVWRARHTHIANRALESFIEQATKEHRPARGKGTRHPKIMGMRQINDAPPVFEMFIKYRTSLHRSYLNYLENKLREQYDFTGTPIIIKLTKMKK